MKKTFTSLSFSAKRLAGKAILALLFCALFCAAAAGQSGSQMEIGDLSAINWKTPVDLDNTIAQERARMDLALSAPDLPLEDRALFLSYQRLLDYLDVDIQAGHTVDQVLPKNYNKVVEEAPSDPDLKLLNVDLFIVMMPGLIEALAEVPVPKTGQ